MENDSQKDLAKKAALKELWRRAELSFKLDDTQKELYKSFYESKYKISTWLLSRRNGKCLKKGTLVMTTNGPKAIEDFKIGDLVYGYNEDGTISLTPVLDVVYSGTKLVRDFTNHNKVVTSCTDEHPWLWYNYRGDIVQKPIGEVSLQTHQLVRKFISIPMGDINEEHSYAIGALLGDGCSRQNSTGNQLFISSEDNIIPSKLSNILNCNYKNSSEFNYTWCLTNSQNKGKHSNKVECHYYNEWIRDRYAHEKIVDLNIIKTWNRKSCLKFLAGLIDTDGSCSIQGNILTISLSMQSRSIIESFKYLFHALFQYELAIQVDNREKYKNGPVYTAVLRNNLFSKKVLKELDPFLNVPRKKWKVEYDLLNENNSNEDSIGIKAGEYYETECYDLSIGNSTHLYLLANGTITHNTFLLCILALEQCLRKSNSIVKFVAPTQKQIKTVVRPIFRQILQDCPEEINPEFRSQDNIYYFPNGSEIQLAGSDGGHAENLRGTDSDLFFIDEAGTCSDLDNIIKSILLPTTLITKGRGILASTPPKESEHDFLAYIEEAQNKGSLIKKTINDNPRITEQQRLDLIEELGGIESEEARRELFCEIIKNARTSVIPEFDSKLEVAIVKEWPKPPFFDAYESMDIGGKDWTAVLYAYYDFRANKLIIEDETVLDFQQQGVNTKKLVEEINKKEKELWTSPITLEYKKPYKRVSDIDYLFISEISNQSRILFAQEQWINFQIAKKDNLEAAINNLRVLIASKKIIINPKCVTLIRHLNNVKWNKNKDKFARSLDGSHYDTVAALIYLARHIDFTKNPYPAGYDINMNGLFVRDRESFQQKNNNQIEIFKKIFGIKPKRK